MTITKAVNFRYSAKKFDTSKKIPDELFSQVEDALQMSASSVNAQPWHFIVTSTEDGKARMAKGSEGMFLFNKDKIIDASHVVLFATKETMDDEYLYEILKKEDSDGRYAEEELKMMMDNGRKMFVNIHKELGDELDWLEKQVYLNVGGALMAAAVLGIDAVPMEGIDFKLLDEEFGLSEKGFKSCVMVLMGYRSEEDFNSKLPKSRLSKEVLITKV